MKVPKDQLKLAAWAYILLILFEGALRKWFLPSLAGPLNLVRDPIALWAISVAINRGIFPKSALCFWMVFIGFVGFFLALFIGHGNLAVAIYGARILVIHFPMLFAIGRIFDREDVLQVGRFFVWVSIPMTLLIALQFYSPQSAWVNIGLGGEVTKGFQGALGHFRPPGTFSFITGTYLFYGLLAAYVLYFWFNTDEINKTALSISTICLLSAIPLSISRTLFFEVCASLFFLMIGTSVKSKYFNRFVAMAFCLFLILVVLSSTSFFRHATDTFFARFENANTTEGGVKGVLGDRFLGGLISAITNTDWLPFWGFGIGMGTNVGSQFLVGGRRFLLHEEEWGRNVDELGPLLGLALVVIRIALTIHLTKTAYKYLLKGDLLPWMLTSFGFLQILQGNWSQPTSLGFCTLIGGLIFASFRPAEVELPVDSFEPLPRFSNQISL